MTTVRAAALPTLLLAAAAALSACGVTGDGSPAPTGPPASGPVGGPPTGPSPTGSLPTLPAPSGPPKTPTDVISNDGSVVGTVTRGGSGHCFGLVTDDGTEYALYHPDGLTLAQGARVRVRLGPASQGTDCGPGRPMQLRSAEPL